MPFFKEGAKRQYRKVEPVPAEYQWMSHALIGLVQIAAHLNVNAMTIRKWIDNLGFPAVQVPSQHGHVSYLTTPLSISLWITEMGNLQRVGRQVSSQSLYEPKTLSRLFPSWKEQSKLDPAESAFELGPTDTPTDGPS